MVQKQEKNVGRKKKEFSKELEKDKEEHRARIRTLPIDTRVMVKFGEFAGRIGKIKSFGRKYVNIKFEEGTEHELKYLWQFAPTDIDERLTDKDVIHTAELNRDLLPGLNKLFN